LKKKLSSAALSIIDPMVVYDPSYISISTLMATSQPLKVFALMSYVLTASYRFTKEVHEDMKTNLPNIPI
jgi:uncharacterized protein YijF (DUF1287 family)